MYEMKFKSKIDWWYLISVLFFSICTFYICYSFSTTTNKNEHILASIMFLLCEFLFLIPNLCFTYYVLEPDAIFVRSGYFCCKYIAYNDIVKIKDRKSIFSPCGLALNRIEITYKYKDSIDAVLISPKEKEKVKQTIEAKIKKQSTMDLNQNKNDQPVNGIIK